MHRTLKELGDKPPSQLMGTLALTGYAAEVNLRAVAQALAQSRVTELRKLIEHVVFIADRAAQAFIDKILELVNRMDRDVVSFLEAVEL